MVKYFMYTVIHFRHIEQGILGIDLHFLQIEG